MDVSEIVVAVGFNANPGKEPHTILGKIWKRSSGDPIANLNTKLSLDPFANIEQRVFQMLSGSKQALSQEQLREQKQQLRDSAVKFSVQRRSVLVAEVERLIALCTDGEVSEQLNKRCAGFIRNEFQPRWGTHHKPGGIEQFKRAGKQHRALPPSFSWYKSRNRFDMRCTREIQLPIPGSKVTLRATGTMDCRTHNGRAIVKFKHELYDDMEDCWRVPDHAATLLMGHIAKATNKFDVEGVSCIAEYFLSDSGTKLLVECRDEPYRPAPPNQCSETVVDPNSAGRMIITVYDQGQINRFYELVEPRLVEFCQIVQRLMVCTRWQRSFYRFADQGRLQDWFEQAKSLESPPM